MTWLWEEGEPIDEMQTDDLGFPQAFRWQGTTHRVERIWRRYRADDLWWRKRLWREYFKLTTAESGLLLLIFKDIENGGWFVLRLYG